MLNKTLHLNLKKQWFDMILSGAKKCEYRDIKPYWTNRLFPEIDYDTITFSHGYAKDRRQMEIEIQDITTGQGLSEWGAMPGVEYYVLCLGEIISTTRCDLKLPSCDVLSQGAVATDGCEACYRGSLIHGEDWTCGKHTLIIG